MAKEVKVSILIDDNGTMRLTEKSAKKLGSGMERVGKSAATADRALKGAAQASSNTSKNFSKMAQGITGGLVPAYATFAANVFAVTAILQAFKNAADVTNLIEGQKALGATTGVAYKTITNSLRDATNGMLSFKEAASAAAIGTSAGLSSGQLEGLASAAKNASAVLGRDLTDSFNRLVRGVTKAEPELLDELGIILRLEDASKKYAEAMGINSRELTTFEKQQAVANDVLGQAEEKYGKIAEIINPAGQAVNRLTASFDQLLLPVQEIATKGFAPVFDFLSRNLTSFGAVLTVIATSFVRAFTPAIPAMDQLGGSVENAANELFRMGNTANKTIKTIKQTGVVTENQLKILERAAKAKNTVVLKGDLYERRQLLKSLAILRAQHKTTMAENMRGFQRYFALIGAGYARATAQSGAFLGTLKFGLAGLGKAVNAIPLIGLGFLLVDLGKEVYRFFNPIPEAIQKANTEADKFIQTSKQLNEEMENSIRIRNEVNLSLAEYVTQLGNAVVSSDILRRIDAFKQLKNADPEKRAEAFKELTTTMERLVSLDSRFSIFLDGLKALEQGKEFPAVDELSLLVSKISEAGVALQRWPDTLKKIQNSIKDVVKPQARNPFFEINENVTAGLEDAKKIIPELQKGVTDSFSKGFSLQTQRSAKALAVQNARAILNEQEKLLKSTEKTWTVGGKVANVFQVDVARGNYNAAKKALELAEDEYKSIEKRIDKNNENFEEGKKTVAQYKLEILKLTELQTAFNDVADEINILSEKNLDIEKAVGLQKTRGLTAEEKIKNLSLDKLNNELNINKAKEQEITARANLAAIDEARRKNSKAYSQEERDTAEDLLKQAGLRVLIAENERDIQNELLDIKIEQTQWEEKRLKLQVRTARAQTSALIAQLGSKTASGGLVSYGINQTDQIQAARIQELETQKKISEEALEAARAEATRANVLLSTNKGVGLEEVQLKNEAVMQAWLAVEAAKQDLELAKNRGKILVNGMKTQTELLQLQNESFYTTQEEAKWQQKRLEIISLLGKDATPELLEQAREEFKIQQDLTRVIEAKKSLVESFNNSLQSGIEGLINGTMSLKDAFKNMAVSVLKQLASIISQMLAMRILATPFFGGITAGLGNLGGSIASTPVSSRMGGVYSNGKAVSGYSTGGVAKGSTSGYPAVLHGTEAVVPLPDGKSIPVSMQGGANTNNVTVNVSMGGSGSESQSKSDSQQGMNIGKIIAGAVQDELHRQKRPGGILSPYGAA